ncbi:MAG: Trk system potassium transporter TrkA [Thermodesulfobacteriota bacterium]
MFGKKRPAGEKILILGLGGIGLYLAKRLDHEGYAVTAIEANPKLIRYADSNIDARIIQGNSMAISCWHEAGASEMDYLIAVTNNDAVNMMAAMIGHRFGIGAKIARVRSLEYGGKDALLSGGDLHIDLFIHPEELAAQEIKRLVKRTAGNEIIDVALGQMQVMATRISATSPLAHKTLMTIAQENSEIPFRVVAIARGITTIIPGGRDEILPQDQILIMAATQDMPQLMRLTGTQQQRRQRVMIMGGGLVGQRIAELLAKTVRVKIIEKDMERAEELSYQLPDTDVLHGDGSDRDVLEEAGVSDMDTFIAATGDNEANIMTSMLVKRLHEEQASQGASQQGKTISLVNKEEYVVLATTSGSDIALNMKILAGNEILTYIRRNELLAVSHMHGFDVEVVDLIAAPGATITKKPLVNMYKDLASHIIIGSVFRDGRWETAVGSTHIQAGDRTIVICKSLSLKEVQEIFA